MLWLWNFGDLGLYLGSNHDPAVSCRQVIQPLLTSTLSSVKCRTMAVPASQTAGKVNRPTCINKCSICISYKMMAMSVLKTEK